MKASLSIALVSSALCGNLLADPSNMRPGLWEITTEMDMPGMPMQMPPQVIRHCYTQQDLARAENTVPQSTGDCQVTNYTLRGNTASWSIECTGQSAMRGTGTMTTHADSYTGSMKNVMQGPGGTMEMTSRWSARRIGACR